MLIYATIMYLMQYFHQISQFQALQKCNVRFMTPLSWSVGCREKKLSNGCVQELWLQRMTVTGSCVIPPRHCALILAVRWLSIWKVPPLPLRGTDSVY